MSLSYVNEIGDHFIAFANHLQRPFWYFEQNIHYYLLNPQDDPILMRIDGIIKRIFFGLFNLGGLVYTFPYAFLAFPLKGLAQLFHGKEFTYWKGAGSEISAPSTHRVTHLNVCMFPGGLPYVFGQVRTAGERMKELRRFIDRINPDLFFLCELSETLSSKVYRLFSERYTHFFVNIGSSACRMDASMAVIGRIPILYAHFFPSQILSEKEQKFSYRGYFLVETERIRYLYIHLHPKETRRAQEIRLEQLEEIKEIIQNNESAKPVVLLGDFNIDRETSNYIEMTTKMELFDPLYEKYGKIKTTKDGQSIDGIFSLKKDKLLIEIDINETEEKGTLALSDHKGVTGNIAW